MQKIVSGLLVSSLVFSSAFAGLESIPTVATDATTSSTNVEKVGIMPGEPMYANVVKYDYDADALKKIYDQKSSLIEVVCQSEDVFKNLGVNSSIITINSLGFVRQDMDVNVDARSCTLFANRTNRNVSNNGTNDEKAMAAAQKILDEVLGKDGLVSIPQLGKPEIIRRDNASMMPMVKDGIMESQSFSGIELISNSGTDTKVEVSYNTITVLYPFMIGTTPLYTSYGGGKMGVSITVDGSGVSNINVPLLAFKGVAKTAEKNTFAGLKNYIAQGGNAPYYNYAGTTSKIKLNTPERVLVYFDYYMPGTNISRKFISDGIRLGSKSKIDQRSQMNYEMILSDFVIGNNSNPILMTTEDTTVMDSATGATIKSGSATSSTPNKIRPKIRRKMKTQ